MDGEVVVGGVIKHLQVPRSDLDAHAETVDISAKSSFAKRIHKGKPVEQHRSSGKHSTYNKSLPGTTNARMAPRGQKR